ncbi:hypothetical protein BDB01DRAFT_800945 [Pilobolus umbonatus]|nr:hypothetical protein BDB01DRAFT_800945 [Pilobolus umbonatus]
MEATWNSFKNKRTNTDLYTQDAVVIYVPSAVGVKGAAEIRKFYLNRQFSEKSVTVQETVYTTLTGGNKLMEEAVWCLQFKTDECKWLVPSIDGRLLMDATIRFPITTTVTFEEDKIASIRYFWDQACVLKQLTVISNKVNWPVAGSEQVGIFESPATYHLRGLNDEVAQLNIGRSQSEKTHHYLHGRVFGPVDPADQVKLPVRLPEPGAPPARNIFTYEPPSQRPLVAHQPNKLGSQFSFTHDDGSNKMSQSFSANTVNYRSPNRSYSSRYA